MLPLSPPRGVGARLDPARGGGCWGEAAASRRSPACGARDDDSTTPLKEIASGYSLNYAIKSLHIGQICALDDLPLPARLSGDTNTHKHSLSL